MDGFKNSDFGLLLLVLSPFLLGIMGALLLIFSLYKYFLLKKVSLKIVILGVIFTAVFLLSLRYPIVRGLNKKTVLHEVFDHNLNPQS